MSKNALRLAAALFAVLALLPSAAAAAAGKIAALDQKWRWVTSARFELLTNGSERDGRTTIEELEAYRFSLGELTGGQTTDPPRPIRIVLFNQVWDMRPYQPLDANGKPEQWAGSFRSRGDAHYFALFNERDQDGVPRTALAGYAHLLTWDRLGKLPPWLWTGLVEYLSAFRYVAREHRADVGRPIAENLRYLNSSSHYPLERVLAMEFDSAEFAKDVPRWLFTAKSWLLVHYLQVGSPERAGALGRIAQNRAAGMDDVKALEQAAGCSIRELDEELGVYQKKSLMAYQSVKVSGDPLEVEIAVRPATREEVAYRLGEYMATFGAERQAEADALFSASGRPAPPQDERTATIQIRPLEIRGAQTASTQEPSRPAPSAHSRRIDELRALGASDEARARAEIAAEMARAPEIAGEFEPLLIELDGHEADRLALAGDFQSGERLLSARVAATSAANRAQAEAALAIFRTRAEFVQSSEQYGAALDLINAQKVEEGAQALRKFLADHPDSEQASAARANLEKVEAYLARRRARQQQQSPPPQPPA